MFCAFLVEYGQPRSPQKGMPGQRIGHTMPGLRQVVEHPATSFSTVSSPAPIQPMPNQCLAHHPSPLGRAVIGAPHERVTALCPCSSLLWLSARIPPSSRSCPHRPPVSPPWERQAPAWHGTCRHAKAIRRARRPRRPGATRGDPPRDRMNMSPPSPLKVNYGQWGGHYLRAPTGGGEARDAGCVQISSIVTSAECESASSTNSLNAIPAVLGSTR